MNDSDIITGDRMFGCIQMTVAEINAMRVRHDGVPVETIPLQELDMYLSLLRYEDDEYRLSL